MKYNASRTYRLWSVVVFSLSLLTILSGVSVTVFGQGCPAIPPASPCPCETTSICPDGCCASGWCKGKTSFTMPNPCVDPNNPNVLVTVDYCYPYPGGPTIPPSQFVISQVAVSPPCTNIGPSEMRLIMELLIEQNPYGIVNCSAIPCSQWCDNHPDCICPSSFAQFQVNITACMQTWTNPVNNEQVYSNCGWAECISIYEVCCRGGVPDATWIGTGGLDECTGSLEGCIAMCVNSAAEDKECCDENGDPCPQGPNGCECPEEVQKEANAPELNDTDMLESK